MRVSFLFNAALSIATFVLVLAESHVRDPEIIVSAILSESNSFGHVVNGEKNSLVLTVENNSGSNSTLLSVSGSVHHVESNNVIKNLTTSKFTSPLLDGVKTQVPYTFFSEFKPGDVRLNVWLEHSVEGSNYVVSAYDSIVTIVEPESTIFDFELISTYLVVAAMLGGLGYYAFITYVPRAKRSRSKKTVATPVSAPSATTATGASGYQEEWIPKHHLRKAKKGASGPSGDEVSGSEVSGSEGKRRKGRK